MATPNKHNVTEFNSASWSIPAEEAAELVWSDEFSVGHAEIDQIHREFVSLIAELFASDDLEVEMMFARLCEHLQSHFKEELSLMTQYDYPVAQCHEDEHARVLQSIQDIQNLVSCAEKVKFIRLFGRALIDWFPGHSTYMDAPLSHWISKKRFGGKPVVIRKSSSSSS